MANQIPEQIARDRIDIMLERAAWSVQNKEQMDPGTVKENRHVGRI